MNIDNRKYICNIPKGAFQWDENKRAKNLEKHGIGFAAAMLVFDTNPYIIPSPRHSENRFTAIGKVGERILAVIYTQRCLRDNTVIRIISARRARKNEEQDYHAQKNIQETRKNNDTNTGRGKSTSGAR